MNKLTWKNIPAVLVRMFKRPLPLLLSYGLSLIAALIFAPMLSLTLRSLFRRPMLVEAINNRSLDILLDVLSAPVGMGSPLLTTIALGLLPIAWLVMWVLRIIIEGCALHAYASEERVSFGEYIKVGWRWILPFFGQGILSLGIYAVCIVVPALLSWFTRNFGGGVVDFISTVVTLVFVTIACLWTVLAEMARAYGVVDDERNIAASLMETFNLLKHAPLRVLLWYLGCAVVSFALVMLSVVSNRIVPVQWWLLNLIVLQGIILLRLVLRLTRWSMNVTVVQACLPQVQSSSEIS